jgi:hypothetical protein
LGKLSAIKPDGKNLREFINPEWANGNGKALEQSVGEFSFLFLNA